MNTYYYTHNKVKSRLEIIADNKKCADKILKEIIINASDWRYITWGTAHF